MPGLDPALGARLRELRTQRGWSLRRLAGLVPCSHVHIYQIEEGRCQPSPELARRLDAVLDTSGELRSRLVEATPAGSVDGDEVQAVELARRVAASDVGEETLRQLEQAFDRLATSYAHDPPEALLPRVRDHLGYVTRLLDARKTLAEHRRLLVAGAWLSLLAATLHIDLRNVGAAAAGLATADQLAGQAGHPEIRAWCLETRAWDILTAGDHPQAARLAQQAQAMAPRGSSVQIQAVAQQGRAYARMGKSAETRAALDELAKLVSSLPRPDQPEHHYRYDPDKALSYTATTLAWVRDPAAEKYARTVIGQLEAVSPPRPRRAALARLDLSLALLAAGKPDEAQASALAAIASGRLVPSNWWRAEEILAGVVDSGIPEAAELRDALETYRPTAGN